MRRASIRIKSKTSHQTLTIMQRIRYIVRFCLSGLLLVALVLIVNAWLHGNLGEVRALLLTIKNQLGIGGLIIGSAFYLLLLSLPFVPGVELGLILMALFGREGIVMVYCSTVGGLLLAFTIGQWLPISWLNDWFNLLGLANLSHDWTKGTTMMLKCSEISRKLNDRWKSLLIKHRYIVLGILFNLPGNSVFGGGGGIALICGASRFFQWKGFALTVMIVTIPVPLLAFLGLLQFESLF